MAGLLAGLDVGTTTIKCLLFDVDGRVVGEAAERTQWRRLDQGQELSPGWLGHAVRSIVREAAARAGERVRGLGITGMAESGLLLDEAARAAGPVVAWSDARADSVVESLFGTVDSRRFSVRTGLRPSGRCTLAKLAWERQHRGDVDPVSWMGVPEWVATVFGADPAAERSLASRTGVYDVRADSWIPEHLAAAGWAGLSMPRLVDAGEVIGDVQVGDPLLDGAAIVLGGHDHLCAAVGAGATQDGDLMDSMGTGEALSRVMPGLPAGEDSLVELVADGLTLGRHPLAGRFALMAGLGSGLVLNDTLRMIGIHPQAPDHLARRARLDGEATNATRYPLLGGESGWQPWEDDARALRESPALLWRAVLAMVARRARHAAEALDRIAGRRERVVASGGWLRSDLVRLVKRQELGPYVWAPLDEPGAFGAAVLAGRAVGLRPHVTATQ